MSGSPRGERDRAPVQLVIFDCDGVLVDSEPIASRVLAETLTEVGFPLAAEQAIDRFTGISLTAVMAQIEAEWGRALPADFVVRVRERDRAAFRVELRAIAGVAEMLEVLAYRRCVASSGSPEKIWENLVLTGLLESFAPHLFSASMVAKGKPAPDLFLFAATTMGELPSRCVVIEDSVAGVLAACAAGMRAYGFCGGGHCRPGDGEALRAAGATRLFSRMADLPALLASAD